MQFGSVCSGIEAASIAFAPPDWPTADRAYQHHHAACPQCRAAGTSPNTQQRCPEGAQLWGTYQQAGDPPHFTWLRKRFATYFLGHASRITC